MTQSLTIFNYPNEAMAPVCNAAVAFIRAENEKLIKGIIRIGDKLVCVKRLLGHGTFGDWLDFHFRMSTSTAENYMNASKAVARFPNLWEYDPSVLYLITSSLPEKAALAIVEAGPVSVEKARCLIQECKAGEWYDEVNALVETDPGMAYSRITFSMDDPNLHDHAALLLEKHAGIFAHHAGREEWEIKKEAGMELGERLGSNKPLPASLFLHEGDRNHRIKLWVDGCDPEDIVILPTPPTAAGKSWQRLIIEVLRESEKLNLRVVDDIA